MFEFKEKVSPIPYCRYFSNGEFQVLVGQEPVSVNERRWHLSISHPSRYPTWDEIKHVRYKFCPGDITMAMLLPPKEQYVNVHPNCFHLHQIHPDDEELTKSGILRA